MIAESVPAVEVLQAENERLREIVARYLLAHEDGCRCVPCDRARRALAGFSDPEAPAPVGPPTRPVLRYHGGKWKLASWVLAHFPEHRVYVEPFGGAASVLMQKPRSYSEVYNDVWGAVVNVFRVLRDPVQAAELERALRLTPYAREEFERARELEGCEPIEMARRLLIRSFMGFGSGSVNVHHTTGFRANSNRNGTTPAEDWLNYPDQIRAFTARLQGVLIENRPALEVLAAHRGRDVLAYVDPPYPHVTRNMRRGNAAYAHEMTDADHRALAEVLRSYPGMVVLSGYPCPLYDEELYPDWTRRTCEALADGARPRTECLWLSPAAEAALRRQSGQLSLLELLQERPGECEEVAA